MPKRSRSWADLPPRKMPMDKIVKDDYDRDLWERTMFQLRELPPKEPSWQNYFASVTASSYSLFLHYYEPELNRLAESFGRKYGLKDQLADIKLVCAEELWKLAQVYDPTSGEEFLANIRMKLMAAVQRYAMTNLKGFSETSATHYYQLRKAAYLYKENQGRIPYAEIIRIICAELDITEKTALRLLQEMDALDHFQWYTNIGSEEDEDEMDAPVGTDILGHCCAPHPEREVIRKETIRALMAAFEELTDKEQDVIGMHLGFCHKCGHLEESLTYDEIADVYQFGTEDGVRRFYHRTLDKLRLSMAQQNIFPAVRLKCIKNTSKKLVYEYTPMDEGHSGVIDFDVRNGIVQPDYRISKTAEMDFSQSQQFAHAAARTILHLVKGNALPTAGILPLPPMSIQR